MSQRPPGPRSAVLNTLRYMRDPYAALMAAGRYGDPHGWPTFFGAMVVTGDPTQVDLPSGQPSGLIEALRMIEGVSGIGVTRFAERDVVRHPLVARIVAAYGRADEQSRAKKERYGTGK